MITRERWNELCMKAYGEILPDDTPASVEDLEAAEMLHDRVLAGCCQNCGKKVGCTCTYVVGDKDNPLRTVIGFDNPELR